MTIPDQEFSPDYNLPTKKELLIMSDSFHDPRVTAALKSLGDDMRRAAALGEFQLVRRIVCQSQHDQASINGAIIAWARSQDFNCAVKFEDCAYGELVHDLTVTISWK